MPEENPLNRVVDMLKQDLRRKIEQNAKSDIIPLGQVRLTHSELRRRWEHMSTDERMSQVESLGVARIMELLGDNT